MAIARPCGDPALGIEGPQVLVIEHAGSTIRRELPFTEAEAEALVAELRGALRTLALARRQAAGAAPAAYNGPWPILQHCTLADPIARERAAGPQGRTAAAAYAAKASEADASRPQGLDR
jgi:hypothetical protein